MKVFVLAVLVLLFFGCASNTAKETVTLMESLRLTECKVGEFRGVGIGANENEALNAAHSELSKQIQSSITVSENYRQSQNVSKGKEELESEYVSEAVVQSNLSNLQDARVLQVKRSVKETGAVVCMSKADAAKGFIEQQRLIIDSLELVSNTVLNTEHPKHKNEAWHKTGELYNRFVGVQNLLTGWGVQSSFSADEVYSKTKGSYKEYCEKQKVYWEDEGNECSEASFAMLSKKVKMEKGECLSGLNLKFSCAEKCKSSSFGVECSAEPSLAIKSCSGESYSLLRVKEPVTGNDMNNQTRAKEKLIKNLSTPISLKEWDAEIMEWIPRCTE